MKKIGRNEPCPCGSGRKFKKCCLHAAPPHEEQHHYVYTDLDILSNQVPDFIKQGKYDEAETVCQTLLEQFPEQIDGLHRYAEVFEAKGDNLKAAEYYRKTAEFAKQAEGFGKESVEFFMKKAKQLAGDEDE
jgi:tetratricopeptide (TPR) repeat protein